MSDTKSGYIGPIEWFEVPGGRVYCLGHERAMAMCFAPDNVQIESLQSELALALEIVDERDHEIESLQRENKRHSEMHTKMAERLCIRQDADGSVTDEIDRLQRANEELEAKKAHAVRNRNEWAKKYSALDNSSVPRSRYKAVCKEVDEWKQKYGDLTAKATAEIDRLEAAAITPEMRERIEEVLRRTDEGYAYDLRKSGTLRGILRDLLKETVEPTLEGEQ